MLNIQNELFKMQDLEYRDFHSQLMPSVNKDLVIGVRVPCIRKFAKELYKKGEYADFLNYLPHKYYEENNLHAFLVEQISDYDECINRVEKFLPYIDNWATCDMFKPKTFKNNKEKLIEKIIKWINSNNTYTVRFGVGMLMTHFLDDKFNLKYSDMVAEIESDEYYINMMIAWYFATALSKHYNKILPYLLNKKLSKWVHNKASAVVLEPDMVLN